MGPLKFLMCVNDILSHYQKLDPILIVFYLHKEVKKTGNVLKKEKSFSLFVNSSLITNYHSLSWKTKPRAFFFQKLSIPLNCIYPTQITALNNTNYNTEYLGCHLNPKQSDESIAMKFWKKKMQNLNFFTMKRNI